MKIHHPCEISVWYIIPCIRSCLAKELAELGFTQKEIGKRLGVTQAAVSQYISEKRGKISGGGKDIQKQIEKLAEEVAHHRIEDLPARICDVCMKVRENKELLRLCGVPEGILESYLKESKNCSLEKVA